jgi:hypothetical protein
MQHPLDVRLPQAVQPRRDSKPARRIVVAELQLVVAGEQVWRHHDVEQAGVEEHVLRLLALGVRIVVEDEDFFRHGGVASVRDVTVPLVTRKTHGRARRKS